MAMRFFAIVGVLAILVLAAAGVFFLGGFYNVAGSEKDSGPVAWALAQVRMASIARHATARPTVSLDDPALVRRGARAFLARGCANCHGAPGVAWAKFSEGMNPGPADLTEVAPERTPEEIFWVARNGIRMTGMPGFATIGADDAELWAIAAFVKHLPKVSEADFKAWTAPAGG